MFFPCVASSSDTTPPSRQHLLKCDGSELDRCGPAKAALLGVVDGRTVRSGSRFGSAVVLDVRQRCRSRTFSCSSETNDSMAALSPHAPTRPGATQAMGKTMGVRPVASWRPRLVSVDDRSSDGPARCQAAEAIASGVELATPDGRPSPTGVGKHLRLSCCRT